MVNETGSKQEFSMCFSSTFTLRQRPRYPLHRHAIWAWHRHRAMPSLHSQHSQLKRSTCRSSLALQHHPRAPGCCPTPYLCPCLLPLPCLSPSQDQPHGGVGSRDMAFLLMLLSQGIRSWYYNFIQLAAPSQSSEIKANKQKPTWLHSGKMQTYIFLLRWVYTSSIQTCGKGLNSSQPLMLVNYKGSL